MKNITYKEAGVDTKEGERAVSLMKEHVKGTMNSNVLTGLGSFGALFRLPVEGMKEPVLVSGTDGVGTKLKIAFLLDRHDTVGIDCVAMCVNDILCQGAKPLFFLDYLATGHLIAEKAAEIVKGITNGCKMSDSALIGGETAEMPGFYQEGEYDMAGFAVGIVDRENIITGETIEDGNVIIGLPSSGIHSNGYSLVRKLLLDDNVDLHKEVPELGESLGEALIRPTKIYVKPCLKVLEKHPLKVKGMVHITGGGFFENIPRILPEGIGVEIDINSWEIPKIFKYMQKKGNIDEREMFSTFNMGIGFMLFVEESYADEIMDTLRSEGEKPVLIGKVKKLVGEGKDLGKEVVLNGKEKG